MILFLRKVLSFVSIFRWEFSHEMHRTVNQATDVSKCSNTTINNPEGHGLVNPSRFDADTWERLIETGYEMSLDPEEDFIPDMDDSWLTPHERRIRLDRQAVRRARNQEFVFHGALTNCHPYQE